MAQKDEFRRKLKKREAKIDKYKTLNKQLGRENTEMKLRLDDMQQKMINLRMKMESKVQEKEFKLMMIKNQMKQLQQVQATIPQNLNMTGILTPGGAGGSVSNNQSMNKVQSQNQLLNILSSLIQKGQAQQQEEDQERKRSQEPGVKQGGRVNQSNAHDYSNNNIKNWNSRFRESDLEEVEIIEGMIRRDDSSVNNGGRESSGFAKSRRFENTMIIPQANMMSPPLVPYRYYVPRSVPRSYRNSKDATYDDDYRIYVQ